MASIDIPADLHTKAQPFLQLTRWREHIPFVVPLTIAGAMLSIGQARTPDWRLAAVLAANILAMSCAFIINDIEDADSDALDRDKQLRNVISTGRITHDAGMRFYYAITFTALVLYTFVGWTTAFLGGLGMMLAYLYSDLSVRLKSRPIVDIVIHGFGAGSLQILIGYSIYEQGTEHAWMVIVAMFLFSAYGQFYNQLEDFELDRMAGINNTTQLVGRAPATLMMYGSVAIAVVLMGNAILRGVFPAWLATVLVVGALASAMFTWRDDMRGNRVDGINALQVPALLVFNMMMIMWLAWGLGFMDIAA